MSKTKAKTTGRKLTANTEPARRGSEVYRKMAAILGPPKERVTTPDWAVWRNAFPTRRQRGNVIYDAWDKATGPRQC